MKKVYLLLVVLFASFSSSSLYANPVTKNKIKAKPSRKNRIMKEKKNVDPENFNEAKHSSTSSSKSKKAKWDYSVALLGGGTYSNVSYGPDKLTAGSVTTTFSTSSSYSYAAGVVGAMAIMDGLDVETGFLYVQNKFKLNSTASNVPVLGTVATTSTVTVNQMQFPVLVRYEVIDGLRIGMGGYLGRYFGSVSTSSSITTGTTTTTSKSTTSFATNKVDQTDYGLSAALNYQYFVSSGLSILADVRYNYGLKNLTTSTATNSKWQPYGFLFMTGINMLF